MAIRLIITITAVSEKGSGELAQKYKARCSEVMTEPGCEQYEIFQSVVNPEKLVLLERWTEPAVLDRHAQANSVRPPLAPELLAGISEREDYAYNRTR